MDNLFICLIDGSRNLMGELVTYSFVKENVIKSYALYFTTNNTYHTILVFPPLPRKLKVSLYIYIKHKIIVYQPVKVSVGSQLICQLKTVVILYCWFQNCKIRTLK